MAALGAFLANVPLYRKNSNPSQNPVKKFFPPEVILLYNILNAEVAQLVEQRFCKP